jgi:hypothetical protein
METVTMDVSKMKNHAENFDETNDIALPPISFL